MTRSAEYEPAVCCRQYSRLHDEQLAPSTEPPKFQSKLKSLTLYEGQHAMLDVKFSPGIAQRSLFTSERNQLDFLANDPHLKLTWMVSIFSFD